MTSPYEKVGFNMSPNFQQQAVSKPASNPVQTPPQTFPPQVNQNTDEFIKSNTADIDALKAELKEELKAEMDAEKQAEVKAQKKANKKGPIQKIKSFIGSFKKFNATAFEYIKGTFKGVGTGALVGSALYGAATILKKQKAAPVLGVIGAVGALGVNLWQASLKANEKRAIIDHTWEKTPIKK